MLTIEEKKLLLSIARKTIEDYLRDGSVRPLPQTTDPLKETRGAFVTLHKGGNLRGCIGQIVGRHPLAETVRDMAIASATEDPRFPSVRESELQSIDIEISALTPLEKIRPEEVVVGKHGLLIAKGPYQGVLLPQVATEYGWNRIQFLENTCMKAGLSPDAWQDAKAELFAFTAEVFGEKDFGGKTRSINKG